MKITRTHIFVGGSVGLVGVVLGAALLVSDSESSREKSATAKASAWRPTPKVELAKGKTDEKHRGGVALAPSREAKTAKPLNLPSERQGASTSSDHGSHAVAGTNAASSDRGAGSGVAGASSGPRILTAEERAKLAQNLHKVDWDKSLADLVAAIKDAKANGRNFDSESFVEAAQVNLALAEAANQLGLKGPASALGDPTVRSVVVPSWLNALGVSLDPSQAAAISSLCLTTPPAYQTQPTSFLEARQAAIQSRIALEQSFSQVLTPQQMQTFAQNVVNDPLMKPSAQRFNLSAADQNSLSGIVSSYWTYAFQLGSNSQQTAQQVAQQYVAQVMAVPPVAANLDPEAARIASLNRTNQLVALQQQAEQSLAASASLSAAERARANQGSRA